MATNKTLAQTIGDACEELASLARWPESDAQKAEADKAIKTLKKLLKEQSYPDMVRYIIVTDIARIMFREYREIKPKNFTAPWIMLTELLD